MITVFRRAKSRPPQVRSSGAAGLHSSEPDDVGKERVRQIEDRARAKLRKWARLERLDSLPI